MLIKYDDGYCAIITEYKSFELYPTGLLNITELEDGGIYAETTMRLPDWLSNSIREAFKREISKQMDRGA